MTVMLDGSDSFDPDGDMITFEWSLVSKPANSQLTNDNIVGRDTPNPSVTPDVDGEYVFNLVVHDAQVGSEPDEVIVTAISPNVPPNAEAGQEQNSILGETVIVDGSDSADPDNGPEPLTFTWSFVIRPATSALVDADIMGVDQAEASFTPDVVGTYVLRLTVSDGEDSDEDAVEILVTIPNVPPNADAGEDQTVMLGEVVTLDGSQSSDPDNGPEALSFNWRFVAVPNGSGLLNVDIGDADMTAAHFTPDIEGSYVLELEAFDGQANDFDNVLIGVSCVDGVSPTPSELWPPNHKMVQVTVSIAERCSVEPVCQIEDVTSNEPVNGLGDGDTAPDWEITGDLAVNLRAERSGTGDGRVYTITVKCTDASGDSSTEAATVTVPHDRGRKKKGKIGIGK